VFVAIPLIISEPTHALSRYEFIVVSGKTYDFCILQHNIATIIRWGGQKL